MPQVAPELECLLLGHFQDMNWKVSVATSPILPERPALGGVSRVSDRRKCQVLVASP